MADPLDAALDARRSRQLGRAELPPQVDPDVKVTPEAGAGVEYNNLVAQLTGRGLSRAEAEAQAQAQFASPPKDATIGLPEAARRAVSPQTLATLADKDESLATGAYNYVANAAGRVASLPSRVAQGVEAQQARRKAEGYGQGDGLTGDEAPDVVGFGKSVLSGVGEVVGTLPGIPMPAAFVPTAPDDASLVEVEGPVAQGLRLLGSALPAPVVEAVGRGSDALGQSSRELRGRDRTYGGALSALPGGDVAGQFLVDTFQGIERGEGFQNLGEAVARGKGYEPGTPEYEHASDLGFAADVLLPTERVTLAPLHVARGLAEAGELSRATGAPLHKTVPAALGERLPTQVTKTSIVDVGRVAEEKVRATLDKDPNNGWSTISPTLKRDVEERLMAAGVDRRDIPALASTVEGRAAIATEARRATEARARAVLGEHQIVPVGDDDDAIAVTMKEFRRLPEQIEDRWLKPNGTDLQSVAGPQGEYARAAIANELAQRGVDVRGHTWDDLLPHLRVQEAGEAALARDRVRIAPYTPIARQLIDYVRTAASERQGSGAPAVASAFGSAGRSAMRWMTSALSDPVTAKLNPVHRSIVKHLRRDLEETSQQLAERVRAAVRQGEAPDVTLAHAIPRDRLVDRGTARLIAETDPAHLQGLREEVRSGKAGLRDVLPEVTKAERKKLEREVDAVRAEHAQRRATAREAHAHLFARREAIDQLIAEREGDIRSLGRQLTERTAALDQERVRRASIDPSLRPVLEAVDRHPLARAEAEAHARWHALGEELARTMPEASAVLVRADGRERFPRNQVWQVPEYRRKAMEASTTNRPQRVRWRSVDFRIQPHQYDAILSRAHQITVALGQAVGAVPPGSVDALRTLHTVLAEMAPADRVVQAKVAYAVLDNVLGLAAGHAENLSKAVAPVPVRLQSAPGLVDVLRGVRHHVITDSGALLRMREHHIAEIKRGIDEALSERESLAKERETLDTDVLTAQWKAEDEELAKALSKRQAEGRSEITAKAKARRKAVSESDISTLRGLSPEPAASLREVGRLFDGAVDALEVSADEVALVAGDFVDRDVLPPEVLTQSVAAQLAAIDAVYRKAERGTVDLAKDIVEAYTGAHQGELEPRLAGEIVAAWWESASGNHDALTDVLSPKKGQPDPLRRGQEPGSGWTAKSGEGLFRLAVNLTQRDKLDRAVASLVKTGLAIDLGAEVQRGLPGMTDPKAIEASLRSGIKAALEGGIPVYIRDGQFVVDSDATSHVLGAAAARRMGIVSPRGVRLVDAVPGVLLTEAIWSDLQDASRRAEIPLPPVARTEGSASVMPEALRFGMRVYDAALRPFKITAMMGFMGMRLPGFLLSQAVGMPAQALLGLGMRGSFSALSNLADARVRSMVLAMAAQEFMGKPIRVDHLLPIQDRFGRQHSPQALINAMLAHDLQQSTVRTEFASRMVDDVVSAIEEYRRPEEELASVTTPLRTLRSAYDKAAGGRVGHVLRHPVQAIGAWHEALFSALHVQDMSVRVPTFIDAVRDGKSYAEAARIARDTFYDYGDLTPVERFVIRKVIPFWSFTRKNLDAHIKAMMLDPSRVGRAARFARGQWTEDERLGLRDDVLGTYALWTLRDPGRGSLTDPRYSEVEYVSGMSPTGGVAQQVGLVAKLFTAVGHGEDALLTYGLDQISPPLKTAVKVGATDLARAKGDTGAEREGFTDIDNTVPESLVRLDATLTNGLLAERLGFVPVAGADPRNADQTRYRALNWRGWRALSAAVPFGPLTQSLEKTQRVLGGEAVDYGYTPLALGTRPALVLERRRAEDAWRHGANTALTQETQLQSAARGQ